MSSSPERSDAPPHRAGRAGWRALWPSPLGIDWRERLRVCCGAALGLLFVAVVCRGLAGATGSTWPWLVAPLGASAVLVFAVPASPLAQPWAVIGGNTLSALVGVACVRWVGPPELAAALAVGGAIGLMLALRCLHPPGGAAALLVVLNGHADPSFVLYPVLISALLLVLGGTAFHRATRHAYPHLPAPALAGARDADAVAQDAALDAVLARHDHLLDISRDDLKALLEDTQLQAYQRKLANIRCGDIMSRQLVTAGHATPLEQARALLREHRIKALPVVDGVGRIVGIVTRADLIRAADGQAQRVGEIMTRQVRVASAGRHLSELIPLFSSTGHHHIPIIGGDDRLVGIVTQSDVVAALTKIGAAPASAQP